ncbi:MAG: pyridoxal phosphate-dependent aminotransferase [Armatimonadetes bacterium]|nr:pyridoxal phosphate-dependent aminotransferase [Armatimonadota bacterium]
MNFQPLLSHQTELFTTPYLRQITLEVLKVNGINLGQGVCLLPTPDFVIEAAHKAALEGHNRYSNPRGTLSMRKALAKKFEHFNGIKGLDPEQNILVTAGSTAGFEAVCGVLLNPGDEAIVFEPTYPYHITALKRYQANIKYLPLREPDWAFDFDAIRDAITERTKIIVVNTPGNPHGKVVSREDLLTLAKILEGTNVVVIADEIYEYMAFDRPHVSAASLPELHDRTITVGGYSKTFSITGWRIGFVALPSALSAHFASFLDFVYVCAPTPYQEAVAAAIEHFDDSFYTELNAGYLRKRDHFAAGLRQIGLEPNVPQGAYYMICRFDKAFPNLTSLEFAQRMIRETGVGSVPSNDFVREPEKAPWVRFCLAIGDEVIDAALDRLAGLKPVAVG